MNFDITFRGEIEPITTLSSLLFCRSVVSDSLQPPWTATRQVSLSFSVSWSLLKLISIELVMPSNYLLYSVTILYYRYYITLI